MNLTCVREASVWGYVWKEMMVSLTHEKKQQKRNETYRVSRDVSTSSLVPRITCADVARNVQN